MRPPPSTVQRFRRRPEYVEAVQSTLPAQAVIGDLAVSPGDWLLMRDGGPWAVLGDAEFRALYVEDLPVT